MLEKEGVRLDNKRKRMLISIIPLLAVIVLFVIDLAQHRYHDIEKAVQSINKTKIKIAQIKKIESNKAIAFYEWGYGSRQQFGYASLEKDIFGWKIINREARQLPPDRKMGWQHTMFPFQDSHFQLIYGKIVDPNITKVVLIQNPKSYKAHIFNFNDGEHFWFIMPNTTLSGYLVRGLSDDGKILEEY